MQETENKLKAASEAYYNAIPTMSDAEYDALVEQHKTARADNPEAFKDTILDKVGAPPSPSSGFTKVKHFPPMLSLDNVFAGTGESLLGTLPEWIRRWEDNVKDADETLCIVIEPKIDGLSIRLNYDENGILINAVTRGDGHAGDDVTANVLVADLVPTILQRTTGPVSFNGEIFVTFEAFAELNRQQAEIGEEPYANPRNAAAGILRRSDPEAVRGQGLSCLIHGVADGSSHNLHSQCMSYAGSQGLPVVTTYVCTPGSVSLDMLTSIARQNYPTDGAVLKVDVLRQRKDLGETSKYPRWAVAFKFAQEEAETTLKAITVQVGRSGVLTPVAELEPVLVDGSVVSRATLHNEDQVNRLGLQVGDRVIIRKAGAIIPEIVRSVTYESKLQQLSNEHQARDVSRSQEQVATLVGHSMWLERPPFNLVKHLGCKCPSCGSTNIGRIEKTTEKVEERGAWKCFNAGGCRAQMAARIQHMASRDCLNLSQMGSELCAEIAFRAPLELDNFEHPFDLFDAPPSWFANLSWTTESGGKMTFGESRATTLAVAMKAAKDLPLRRWIAALGIHSVGQNTSKEISRLCNSANNLLFACKSFTGLFQRMVGYPAGSSSPEFNTLKEQYGISHHLGPVSLMALVNFCNGDLGARALSRIPDTVVSDNYAPEPSVAPAGSVGPLTGKTFVVTGTLSEPRDKIHAVIEAAGGTIASSISVKTSVLVAGDKAGSKLTKAAKLNVEVWTEERLRKEVDHE